MPALYKNYMLYQRRLELQNKDMQDIEFTIEKGKLCMLQCRVGKRNGGVATVRVCNRKCSKTIDR